MLHWFPKFRAVLLVLLILCLIWVSSANQPVLAQDSPLDLQNSGPDQRSINRLGLDSSNIPSEKVSQFVQACLQVVTLIERREGDLQATETEAESSRIEQEIEAAALAIIEKNGLTRQEYLQLLGLANTDPEFGERVAIQLQETSS
jgi:hypothetical protein